MHPRAEEDAFLFTFINYFLRITKDQREKAAAFTRAIVTRPSVKSKSVASCSGYEIANTEELGQKRELSKKSISYPEQLATLF